MWVFAGGCDQKQGIEGYFAYGTKRQSVSRKRGTDRSAMNAFGILIMKWKNHKMLKKVMYIYSAHKGIFNRGKMSICNGWNIGK